MFLPDMVAGRVPAVQFVSARSAVPAKHGKAMPNELYWFPPEVGNMPDRVAQTPFDSQRLMPACQCRLRVLGIRFVVSLQTWRDRGCVGSWIESAG